MLYVGRNDELSGYVRVDAKPATCRGFSPGSHSTTPWPSASRPRRPARPVSWVYSPGVRSAWVSPFQAATWIAEVEPGRARTVSVTGGEPLVWPGFVKELRRYVGPRRVHLETAGAHPQALEEVIDSVDHVSLDLKLPADLDAPLEVLTCQEPAPASALEWSTVRARVLELVRGKDACGKLIVAGNRRAEHLNAGHSDARTARPGLVAQ